MIGFYILLIRVKLVLRLILMVYRSRFFKQFKFQLLRPLLVLCGYLIDQGQIPSPWKFANVTPVLKKGLASVVYNYRPIF